MLTSSSPSSFPRQIEPDHHALNDLDINGSLTRQLEAIQRVLLLNKEIALHVERISSQACAPQLLGRNYKDLQNYRGVCPRSNSNGIGESSSLVNVFQATPTQTQHHFPLKAIKQALAINSEIAEQLKQDGKTPRPFAATLQKPLPNSASDNQKASSHEIYSASDAAKSLPMVSDKPEWQLEASRDIDLSEPLIQRNNSEDKLDTDLSTRDLEALGVFFPDTEDIKTTVFETLRQQAYNVEKFYRETGIWQSIARHSYFHHLGLGVIFLNMFWIGFETEWNHSLLITKATIMYTIVDNCFTGFFAFEIFVRCMAFKDRSLAFTDRWFLFDTFMVCAMMMETLVLVVTSAGYGFKSQGEEGPRGAACLRLLRVARIARVFRAQRLLRSWSELLILLRGIAAGFRSVLAVLCLLALIVYVFGIIFVLMLRDTGAADGIFNHLHTAMNELLMQIICGPDEDLIKMLLEFDWIYYVFFLTFLIIANYTVMNLLIGILCDAVSEVAQDAKDQSFAEEVDLQISRMTAQLDLDCDGYISQKEFDVIIHEPALSTKLNNLGVDIVAVADFARFIFTQADSVSYVNFANMMGQFRVCKLATVGHVANVMRHVTTQLRHMEMRLRSEETKTRRVVRHTTI